MNIRSIWVRMQLTSCRDKISKTSQSCPIIMLQSLANRRLTMNSNSNFKSLMRGTLALECRMKWWWCVNLTIKINSWLRWRHQPTNHQLWKNLGLRLQPMTDMSLNTDTRSSSGPHHPKSMYLSPRLDHNRSNNRPPIICSLKGIKEMLLHQHRRIENLPLRIIIHLVQLKQTGKVYLSMKYREKIKWEIVWWAPSDGKVKKVTQLLLLEEPNTLKGTNHLLNLRRRNKVLNQDK